jgi:protein-S-isoprenylcysteine O-methyltransferase Ste14
MFTVKLAIFVVASCLVVIVSVRRPSRHSPYRLLAWEFLLGLLLLNAGPWFRDPFSVRQIASWLLLIASGYLVIEGLRLLRRIGKPRDEVEDTTVLVVVGLYKYLRHPLYASLLFLGWGAFLKDPSLLAAVLVVAASAALLVTAKVEEGENVKKFGEPYVDYMKRTKMFVPFVL